MLKSLGVARTYSCAAPVDCSADSFTIWRFSSRHGLEISPNTDREDGAELQQHVGAYELRKTTWTGVSSNEGPVLVVHFVHPSVYNPTQRNSSSGPVCVFSLGRHKAKREWGLPA
jgi:hypothetical protein